MTRFGSCSTGLLGLGRWKLRISSWKVTVDKASHSKFSLLCPHPFICIACLDTEVVAQSSLNCLGSFRKSERCPHVFSTEFNCPIMWKTAKLQSCPHSCLSTLIVSLPRCCIFLPISLQQIHLFFSPPLNRHFDFLFFVYFLA